MREADEILLLSRVLGNSGDKPFAGMMDRPVRRIRWSDNKQVSCVKCVRQIEHRKRRQETESEVPFPWVAMRRIELGDDGGRRVVVDIGQCSACEAWYYNWREVTHATSN